MGFWARQVVPRVVDLALRSDDIAGWRNRCMDGLAGTVVEPGFGSGLNVAHYPASLGRARNP